MSEIKLKPCPFCGGEVRLMTYDGCTEGDGSPSCINYEDELECGTSFVHCYNCDTDYFPHFETAKDVLEQWNTRKSVDAVLDRLENAAFGTPQTYDEDGFGNDDSEKVILLDRALEIVKENLT